RKRVDAFGVAEPVLQPAGGNRIMIQIPGLSEADKDLAKENIQKAAFLEFRMGHPDSSRLIQEGALLPGYEKLVEKRVDKGAKGEQTQERLVYYLVEKRAQLTGKSVKKAFATLNSINGSPEINFELDEEGAKIFAGVTRTNEGRFLAIVLDGEIA